MLAKIAPSTCETSSNFNARRIKSSSRVQVGRSGNSRLNTAMSTARPITARPQTGASLNTGRREAGYVVAIIEGRGDDSPCQFETSSFFYRHIYIAVC